MTLKFTFLSTPSHERQAQEASSRAPLWPRSVFEQADAIEKHRDHAGRYAAGTGKQWYEEVFAEISYVTYSDGYAEASDGVRMGVVRDDIGTGGGWSAGWSSTRPLQAGRMFEGSSDIGVTQPGQTSLDPATQSYLRAGAGSLDGRLPLHLS